MLLISEHLPLGMIRPDGVAPTKRVPEGSATSGFGEGAELRLVQQHFARIAADGMHVPSRQVGVLPGERSESEAQLTASQFWTSVTMSLTCGNAQVLLEY